MSLSSQDATEIKRLLNSGMKQHDVAALYGVNGGRIAEIAKGTKFNDAPPLDLSSRYLPLSIDKIQRWTELGLERDKLVSEVFEITPSLADKILKERNFGNRKRAPKNIRDFTEFMSSGTWEVNGFSLKFDETGFLMDGQNRLNACRNANTSFVTMVTFNVPRHFFVTMDRGKPRTAADMLLIEGCQNAAQASTALRWIMILTSENPKKRGLSVRPDQILHFYKIHIDKELLQKSLKAAIQVNGAYRQPIGQLAAIHYCMHSVDDEKINEFFSLWARQHRRIDKLQSALGRLRDRYDGRVPEDIRIGTILNAFGQFFNGKRIGLTNIIQAPGASLWGIK